MLILASTGDMSKERKSDMPAFSCDADGISTFKPCVALYMFTAYERSLQDLSFDMFT